MSILPFNDKKEQKPIPEAIKKLVLFLAEKAVEEYMLEVGQASVKQRRNNVAQTQKTLENGG